MCKNTIQNVLNCKKNRIASATWPSHCTAASTSAPAAIRARGAQRLKLFIVPSSSFRTFCKGGERKLVSGLATVGWTRNRFLHQKAFKPNAFTPEPFTPSTLWHTKCYSVIHTKCLLPPQSHSRNPLCIKKAFAPETFITPKACHKACTWESFCNKDLFTPDIFCTKKSDPGSRTYQDGHRPQNLGLWARSAPPTKPPTLWGFDGPLAPPPPAL